MNNIRLNKNMVTLSDNERKVRVEDEVIFPDYAPDIVKIIRVDATPSITSKSLRIKDGSALLDLSGKVKFCVVYLSDEGCLESYPFFADFFDSLKVPLAREVDEESVVATARVFSENVVCKAQSPRKVSARCDVALFVNMKGNTVFDALSTDTDEKIEKSPITATCAEVVGSARREYEVSEEIRLPNSYPPMEKIISCRVGITLDNTSVNNGYINFWGTMTALVLYVPESDGEGRTAPQSFCQPIEITGKLEADDATDRSAALGSLSMSDSSFEILTDNLGENRVLKLDGSYIADFILVENAPMTLVFDAYGIGCEATPVSDTRAFLKYEGELHEKIPFRERISVREGVSRLEDCNAEARLRSWGLENGKMYAEVRVTFNAVGSGELGEESVSEDFDLHLPMNLPSEVSGEGNTLLPDFSFSVGYIDAKVRGGEAEVSFDIAVSAAIFSEKPESFISSLELSDIPVVREGQVFYYPTVADTLWSVGKRYAVSQKALTDANTELRRVMLIP